MHPSLANARIAVIGLGYVGLPLAVEFGKRYDTVGFDINTRRVAELRTGHDATLEVEPELLASSTRLQFADQLDAIADCNVYIVTVPTPIDAAKRPDLTPLVKASEAIGAVLRAGDTVIYESTVYPGCTEEVCVPILERVSGLCYEAGDRAQGGLLRDARGADDGNDDGNRARGALLRDFGAPDNGNDGADRAHGALLRDAGALDDGDDGADCAHGPHAQDEGGTEPHGAATTHRNNTSCPDASRTPVGAPHGRDHGTTNATTTQTFAIGYSPERINPGDKAHRVTTIKKVTSGSSPATADFVDALYASIITAGTHKAPTIKVAEAAKVIENTQRDLNIALVNDLAILFNKLGIDTLDVLEAAGTKWNFLPFRPGLVGGHCISVDPYYLTHKAQEVGHHPQVILAGRRTNDHMGAFVAEQVLKLLLRKAINPVGARVLVLGLAFKENCPDLRNTRVVDIVSALRSYNARVEIHDPWVDAAEAHHEYGLELIDAPGQGAYDAVILAVGHDEFKTLGAPGIRGLCKPQAVVYDVKHVLPRDVVDGRL